MGAEQLLASYLAFIVAGRFGLVMALKLDEITESELSITDGASAILTYRYGRHLQNPYFHPICTPTGLTITADAPESHFHHHGLWAEWGSANGINYWDEAHRNKLQRARVVHREFREKGVNPHAAFFTVVNDWVAPDNSKPIEEICQLTLHQREADREVIDLQFSLQAQDSDVSIDSSPGSQGLCIRSAEMEYRKVASSEGCIGESEVTGKMARWCSLNGILSDRAVGVAIFDHPSNLRHPTHFCTLDEAFGFISTAFTFNEPYVITAGETLALKYRVLIYLGDVFTFDLSACYEEYAEQ